jgi:elongation factor Ts
MAAATAVTAAMVKELRERTGLGMMDCKRALTDADGDLDQAIDALRKSSSLKAATKAGRTAADGLLGIRISDDGSCGVMIEVNIETDFAARNEKFIEFVGKITDAAFDRRERDVETLLAGGLGDERETLVQEIGENVTVRRIAVIDTDGGRVGSYMHVDNRKATLVELDGGDVDLGKNIAMHVTAIAPLVVNSDDVSPELLDKEREIYLAQAQDSGKPPEIVAKIVDGRIRKYLAGISLVDQPFVKDPDVKVGKLLAEHSARCISFVRFEVGEGIDKAQEDFAAEVAAQVKGRTGH